MKPDFQSPISCACFNARAIARQITKSYDRAMKPAGIRATQFSLLAVLASNKSAEGFTMTELADAMSTDRTTLTRNLAAAEKEGWLVVYAGEDGRERRAELTSQGKKKVAEARPLWLAAQKAMIERIGESGLNNILRLNAKLGR